MKKFLLLGVTALTTLSALALEPRQIDSSQVQAISPDGSFLVSLYNNGVQFIDTETGEVKAQFGGEAEEYGIGHGNCISDLGTLVGFTPMGAAWYKNGNWTMLDVPADAYFSYANGISKDDKVIVGSIMANPMTTDDTEIPMLIPVYWELNSDGTYSTMKTLPYPEKDLTGRVPQYVTAISVAEDLNTIVGQVVDYSGSLTTLIVYTHLADGSWEYTVFNELINPDNLVFPEYPAEIAWVNYEDYMTPDELQDYQDAITSYYELQDWEAPYPEFTDFMTDEERAAYDAAMADYYEALEDFNTKLDAFNDVLFKCMEDGTPLMMNNLKFSADNKTVFSTNEKELVNPDNEWDVTILQRPVSINIETLEVKLKEIKDNVGITVSNIAADNTVLGFSEQRWREAMVYLPDSDEPLTLLEYFQLTDTEVAEWIKENMYRDLQIYDWRTDTWNTEENCALTGTPFCNANHSVFATAVQNLWDIDNPSDIFTYILPGKASGVKNMDAEKDSLKAKAFRGGRIAVEGVADSITVYDMNGKIMYNATPNSSVIETGLTSGAYIVKIKAGEETKIIKAIF